MWKIHRYYLREILVNLAMVLGVLFGIVMLAMVPRGLEKAEGFGLLDAVLITTFWALDALPHLLPITLVFAIVLTYARASQEREITAIRAAGVSPRVASVPAMLVGVIIGLLGSMLMHYLVPQTHYAKNRVVADSIRSVMTGTGMLKDVVHFKGMSMTWEHRNALGHWIDVEIVVDPNDDADLEAYAAGEGSLEPLQVVLAKEAALELSENGQDLALALTDALSVGDPSVFLGSPRIAVNLRSVTGNMMLNENDDDIATDQLLSEVLRGVHPNPRAARFMANRRNSFALLPTLLAPIAFCIGVLARDRGRVFALVLGTIPVLIAYASDVLAQNLVRDIDLPALAWLPVFVLVALGVPFCWRLLRF